jgi:hypothetical protein
MKLRHILFALLFLPAFCASSQVTVSVLKDDPEGLNIFRVKIPIWIIQPATANFSIYAADFGLEAQVNDKFYFSASYNTLLADRLLPDSQDGLEYPATSYVASKYEDQFSRYFHLEGTYFFKKYLEQVDVTIGVKSTGNTRYVVSVPAKMLKKTGVRFAYRKGFQWYHLADEGFKSNIEFDTEDQSTYLNYSQIRLGIARAKTTNLWVNLKDYGDRTSSSTSLFYADLIIPISQKFDDVYYFQRSTGGSAGNGNTVYYTSHKIDEYNEKQKVGFEVGWRVLPTAGLMGYQIQFGTVTGLKGYFAPYLEMGLTLQLGNRAKL